MEYHPIVKDREGFRKVLETMTRILIMNDPEEHEYFLFMVDAYNQGVEDKKKFNIEDFKDKALKKGDITVEIMDELLSNWEKSIDFYEVAKINPHLYGSLVMIYNELTFALAAKREVEAEEAKNPVLAKVSKEEAKDVVEKFLNGTWITDLFITRPAKLFTPTYKGCISYGCYNVSKNRSYAYIVDNPKTGATGYMSRGEAIEEWLTTQLSAYAHYIKSNQKVEEENDRVNFIDNLLSGFSKRETSASEREWAEGEWADTTFTGPNIPGVVLRVDPVEFSEQEIQRMASLIIETENNASAAADCCIAPDQLDIGGITINLPKKTTSNHLTNIDHRTYDLDLINIDRSADGLVKQIADVMSRPLNERPDLVSCLFYGPPGCGKSLLAKYIGERLNLKVVKKTYADLQSMYVGEGEKELQAAFEDASNSGSILLIDEIDSIAGSRATADRNYEKTFVNQLLNELDEYKGIFIATSNHINSMDPAIMRRLYLKLKFDFLSEEQIQECFKMYFPRMKKQKLWLERDRDATYFKYLTPGDFKAIREALVFEESVTISKVRELLKQEVDLKKKTMQDIIQMERPTGYEL
jgi:hypothetical protein